MASSPIASPPPATTKESSDDVDSSNLREIGGDAVWSLSTAKPGNGVEQLRDNNTESYWQSDGTQPHLINIQFQKKQAVAQLRFYLDFKLDESYTPKKMSIRYGTSFHDLRECQTLDLQDPNGWVTVNMENPKRGSEQFLRTNFIQVCILSMHQNGRDTHVRQVEVYGPRQMSRGPFRETFPTFSCPEMEQFSTVR